MIEMFERDDSQEDPARAAEDARVPAASEEPAAFRKPVGGNPQPSKLRGNFGLTASKPEPPAPAKPSKLLAFLESFEDEGERGDGTEARPPAEERAPRCGTGAGTGAGRLTGAVGVRAAQRNGDAMEIERKLVAPVIGKHPINARRAPEPVAQREGPRSYKCKPFKPVRQISRPAEDLKQPYARLEGAEPEAGEKKLKKSAQMYVFTQTESPRKGSVESEGGEDSNQIYEHHAQSPVARRRVAEFAQTPCFVERGETPLYSSGSASKSLPQCSRRAA